MKIFFVVSLVSSLAFADATGSKKTLPVSKEEQQVKKNQMAKASAKEVKALEKLKEIEQKTEDCDDKAKKPVEIKPESISLSGGNTGCSVDGAH